MFLRFFRSSFVSDIALRYLWAQSGVRFVRLSIALSWLGIVFGVGAILVVLSVMLGFERELKKKLITNDAHVIFFPTPQVETWDSGFIHPAVIDQDPRWIAVRSSPAVQQVSFSVSRELILQFGKKTTGVVLKGFPPADFEAFESKIRDKASVFLDREDRDRGITALPEVFVGEELALKLALIPGDEMTLLNPIDVSGPMSGVPRSKVFRLGGVFKSTLPEQEQTLVVTRQQTFESFVRKKSVLSQIEIRLKHPESAPKWAGLWLKQLPEFRAQDWMNQNRQLFASMQLERFAMFVILLFTVLIASLNCVSNLSLMVREKMKDISVLRAMGATSKDIDRVFTWIGVILAATGVGLGSVLAAILCWILSSTQWIELPDIYYDRSLPVSIEPAYFLGIGVVSFLLVIFCARFPAKKAGRLGILDGFRLS